MKYYVVDSFTNERFCGNPAGVCISAHSILIPFWSKRLHKTELLAKQLSKRGGTLMCKDLGERVEIGGAVVTHLIGDILP